jgi:hypothetical protein
VSAIFELLRELDESERCELARWLEPYREAPTDDPWLRGAHAIAGYIGAPRSRVYRLRSADRIPVEKEGGALIARRAELDAFIRAGGAKRP